jgi:hypothetical protein
MEDGQLLCIHQTTHALMSAQFCRFWGNDEFAPPQPYTPVMMAIAQHDNGWFEWEESPRLCDDGTPMDFITYTDQAEKTRLWQRGIDRVWAQHPYAALLISRHASLLYEAFQFQDAYDSPDNCEVVRFLADQKRLLESTRRLLGHDDQYLAALQPEVIEANTRLLQFGDLVSLQVSIPWADQTTIQQCPVDYTGKQTSLEMRFDEETITFDPWPYSVNEFEVTMEGFLLEQKHFDSEEAYHQALANAPYYRRVWRVVRGEETKRRRGEETKRRRGEESRMRGCAEAGFPPGLGAGGRPALH